MYKIILSVIASTVLVAACNNSSEKKDKPADTTANSGGHDMHNVPDDNTAVTYLPALPEGHQVFL